MKRTGTAVLTLLLVIAFSSIASGDGSIVEFSWGGPEPPVEPGFKADKLYQLSDLDSVDPSSGGLTIRIPIGFSYPVNGGMSYGLTLTYSTQIWDFRTRIEEDPPNCDRYHKQAYPTLRSNAGVGWTLSLGQLIDPSGSQSPTPWGVSPTDIEHWTYISPDGSQHRFFDTLHRDETVTTNGAWVYWYSRDGSYLRMKFQLENDTIRYVEFPDGSVHVFSKYDQVNDKWRLTRMADSFGNSVLVSYGVDTGTGRAMWTLWDSHRYQKIYFDVHMVEGVPVWYVDEVELSAGGSAGTTASYLFIYTDTQIMRNGQHTDPDVGTENPVVPLLTGLSLPDGTSYTMSYYDEICPSWLSCPLEEDQPGVIERVMLPTGGGIEWTYQTYSYGAHANWDDCPVWNPCALCQTDVYYQSAGVAERRLVDNTGNPTATWTYDTWVDWAPTIASIPEERHTVVTSPEDNATVYYFRTNPKKFGNVVVDPKLKGWDCGLPYTRRECDVAEEACEDEEVEDKRFLSVEYYKGKIANHKTTPVTPASGTEKLRSVYVRYQMDELQDFGADLGIDSYFRHVNRHLVSQRTVYWDDKVDDQGTPDPGDDEYRYELVNRYDFDGLGHHRTTVTEGNFESDATFRRSDRAYNPSRGTYKISSIGLPATVSENPYPALPGDESPPFSYTQPAATYPWVLGTYPTESTWEVNEGGTGQVITREHCFDADTGALLRTRFRSDNTFDGGNPAGSRSNNDVLVVYEYFEEELPEQVFIFKDGNISDLLVYGGDQQPLDTTTALCDLDLTPYATQYHVAYDYDAGVMNRSWFVDGSGNPLGFLSTDYDIEASTGLITTARAPDGLATSFEYDLMGRLRWIKPSAAHGGAWTEYEYENASASEPAKVWERRRQNGLPTTRITEQEYRFDDIGRLYIERKRLKDGSWTQRDTEHNGSGWKTAVTEWHDPAAKAITQTEYSEFDPFARPGRVTPPDGASHDVELDYVSSRTTTKTVDVGSSQSGGAVSEVEVSTEEIKDRHGRLIQVIERPSDSEEITTTYDYDITGKLASVTVASGVQSQTRTFEYDGLGLLRQECHPELGSGGGCIYYNEYDAAGNVVEKTDGDTVYHYSYDRAKRLTRVESTRGGVAHTERELFYGTANDGTNRKLGKLEIAVGHNYWSPSDPTANLAITETYEYRGLGGAISKRTTDLLIPHPNRTSIVQEFTWNQLGAPESQQYPKLYVINASGDTISSILLPRTVTNSYTWGWLSGVQGYTNSMSYHKNGMINEIEHANGVIDTFVMDDASMQRPKRITVSGLYAGTWSTGDISYDGAGNITAMGSDWFLYDGISRLTQAHLADVDRDGVSDAVDIAYRYDPFGNRTDTYWSDTNEQGGVTTSWYTIGVDTATNRLLGEAYDSKGNMTSLHGDAFTWYPFNQLQTRTGTGRNYTYGYTVDGERLLTLDASPDPDQITITVRDLDGKVTREFILDGSVYSWKKDYIYANGKLLATVDPTHGTRHHHLDHLGTPRVITDTSGNRIAYNAYSPYGLQLTGETNERHKFTGHERDPGNLDYMHARYYSPAISKFLSFDPAEIKAGGSQMFNRYTYALNNPSNYFDPDGRDVTYSTEKLRKFYEGAAERNWMVRETLKAYGPGSGRDLHIRTGDPGSRSKSGTRNAGLFEGHFETTATQEQMIAVWNIAKTLGIDGNIAQAIVNKFFENSFTITKATITLSSLANKKQKLHELGHAQHAVNDPNGYIEAADKAEGMDDDEYKDSLSETTADEYAEAAAKKAPGPPEEKTE